MESMPKVARAGAGRTITMTSGAVRRNRQPRQTADYFTDGRRSVCAEGNRVDLLLADVVIPGMSGRELATEFNTLCPSGQVLLMSDGANELALCQLSLILARGIWANLFPSRSSLSEVREALRGGSCELKIPRDEIELQRL
jgi:DNA-binding NarL/FixJ family response regulator